MTSLSWCMKNVPYPVFTNKGKAAKMLKLDLISNIVVLGSGVFGTRTFSVSRQPWSCLVWKNKSFCSSHVLCVSHIAHLHIFICSCVQCVLCVWEYVSQGESVDVRRYLLVLILPMSHVGPRDSTQLKKSWWQASLPT